MRQALRELGSLVGVTAAEALRHVLQAVLCLVVQPDAGHSAADLFPCGHEKEAGGKARGPGRESCQQKVIMPPPQQIAEFLTPAPGQAGEVEMQGFRQLAQGGVEHRLAHALRQPLLLESERAEELPPLAAEQVQIGAFQGTAARSFRLRRAGVSP